MRNMVRDTSRKSSAKFLCIQETKCNNWPTNGLKLLGNSVNENWLAQNSDGASGGLVTSWYADLFYCIGWAQSQFWIWVQLKSRVNNGWFNIVNVYSPLTLAGKKLLWKELLQIMEAVPNEPICLVGDFNCIRDPKERANCTFRRTDIKGFNSFIKNANLMDLEMENKSFTWFGPQGKCSKLDRFLVNSLWFESGMWNVKALSRLSSDH